MNLKELHPKYFKQLQKVRFPLMESLTFTSFDDEIEFVFECVVQNNHHWYLTRLANWCLQYATQLENSTYLILWVRASNLCAKRTKKYSVEGNPYFNFEKMAEVLDKPIDEVFKFYMSIKYTRLLAQSGDHEDETITDTLIDLANYALLYAGYIDNDD
jgi:hypothetical protein